MGKTTKTRPIIRTPKLVRQMPRTKIKFLLKEKRTTKSNKIKDHKTTIPMSERILVKTNKITKIKEKIQKTKTTRAQSQLTKFREMLKANLTSILWPKI